MEDGGAGGLRVFGQQKAVFFQVSWEVDGSQYLRNLEDMQNPCFLSHELLTKTISQTNLTHRYRSTG